MKVRGKELKWSERAIGSAIRILGKHTTARDALDDIELELGFPVTFHSLDCAFRSSGMGSASSFCKKQTPPSRANDRPPLSVVGGQDMDRDAAIVKLVLLAKRGGLHLEELCDELEMPPGKVRELIGEGQKQGYSLTLENEFFGRRPAAANDKTVDVQIAQAGEHRVFAIASDLHFGNKHHLRAQFVDFIQRAYARGARTILLPGDLLDGVYRHSRWEQYAQGFREQVADFIEGLPQHDGLNYVGISGNHDQTFEDGSGMDAARAIEESFHAAGRTDLQMLGARGATVRLLGPGDTRGLLVEMWHPVGKPAFTLSYKLQHKIAAYHPGHKPDVLLAGHWHQQVYFVSRGVHAMSCGTFQGGKSSYGRSLGTEPSIGGWFIEYAQTPDGTVRNFKPEWNAYYEQEEARAVKVA